MKQTALMVMLVVLGTAGSFIKGPFVGVAVYYLFAVLRPQSIWQWSLPADVSWSFYVAIAAIASSCIYLPRFGGKKFTYVHAAMFGFATWVTLSNVFALDSQKSSYWYWEYLKVFTMFFCASFVMSQLKEVRLLYLIAVMAIGYIAYEVNYLYLVNRRLDIYHVGFGSWDNNTAGLTIAMGVPLAYFLWQHYEAWWRWIFLGLVPLMLHAVFMSYSRGAMLALLLTSPLFVIRSRRKLQMLFAIGCFAVIVPMLAGAEIRARFFSIDRYKQDQSAQGRLSAWRAAWAIAKDYPILGVGLRNSDLLSYQYGADVPGRAIHSQYFQFAADCGFPALGFYLLVLVGTWRALRRTQRRCRDSESDDDWLAYDLACGIEGSLAIFCIGASFLSLEVFELPYLLILLGLKLSLVAQEEPAEAMSPAAAETVAYQTQKLPASV